jgi:hypothetical protein
MPTLEEALSAAFDGPTETPAPAPEPVPAAEGDADTAPDLTAASPDTTPDSPPDPPAAAAIPVNPDAVDVSDLKAVKERILADHPELEPVLSASLKEMERGLQRRFDQLSALKREAAEQVLTENRLQGIPGDELAGMAEWYRLSRTDPAKAADALFQMSEQLRAEAQNPTSNPYGQLPPQVAAELQQMRDYVTQQTQTQIIAQIESTFTGLAPEFGGNAIPENQKRHVLETVQARNLGIEDIGMVWKALYGADYAKQAGIKAGQQLRQQKAGLAAGTTAAPAAPAGTPKPKDLRSALEEICTAHGVR